MGVNFFRVFPAARRKSLAFCSSEVLSPGEEGFEVLASEDAAVGKVTGCGAKTLLPIGMGGTGAGTRGAGAGGGGGGAADFFEKAHS